MTAPSSDDVRFEAATPLGFSIRVTEAYWQRIVTIKHPVMNDEAEAVQKALRAPDEVRQSRSDATGHLFYRQERLNRWACAVANRLNSNGFLITTYPTDAIKGGKAIWPT